MTAEPGRTAPVPVRLARASGLRACLAAMLLAACAPAFATVSLACRSPDARLGVELQIELSAAPGRDIVGVRVSGRPDAEARAWRIAQQSIDYAHRRVHVRAEAAGDASPRALALDDDGRGATLRFDAGAAQPLSCDWDAIG